MPAPTPSPLQTEFEFDLPRGYVDTNGGLHRHGKMRLATAMDEIAPLRDPRVKSNPAYLSVLILSRVVTELGELGEVNTHTIENLFAADLAYLQDLYRRVNSDGAAELTVTCPECSHSFQVEVSQAGG
ncbi:MAG: phage tail assembly protein [Anaerolineae bacterium]